MPRGIEPYTGLPHPGRTLTALTLPCLLLSFRCPLRHICQKRPPSPPNCPFSSETVISYFLQKPGPARVGVYSLAGQRVTVLDHGLHKAGIHRIRWDGHDDEGRLLGSGIYLYRLVTDEVIMTRKLTLLK